MSHPSQPQHEAAGPHAQPAHGHQATAPCEHQATAPCEHQAEAPCQHQAEAPCQHQAAALCEHPAAAPRTHQPVAPGARRAAQPPAPQAARPQRRLTTWVAATLGATLAVVAGCGGGDSASARLDTGNSVSTGPNTATTAAATTTSGTTAQPATPGARRAQALQITPSLAPAYNYAEALQKSILFYEAQQSGALPAWNRVKSWRGDSRLSDGADIGRDLTGGWYDAGDHVKFGFPMAYSATQLAWGGLRFAAGYQAAGQYEALLANLRFVNDYFLRAHIAPNELVVQVGNGGTDHSWWGPVEVYPLAAPTYKITASCGGSDVAAETAAAMAAASMLFAPSDPSYANQLLTHARQLYTFADTVRAKYSDCVPDAANYYRSWSGYADELAWGAAWLYRATGEAAYLQKAESWVHTGPGGFGTEGQSPYLPYKWTVGWDNKQVGVYLLLAESTGKAVYKDALERNLDYWTTGTSDGQRVTYTPGGLAWLEQWGSLRYVMNEAFIALAYADIVGDATKAQRWRDFATRQVNYVLGDNPRHSSYVIGFGVNPPQRPHHRTAHGSWLDSQATPAQHRHLLYGALVGGPGSDDSYSDDIGNYVSNEVATDYNAAFSGVLAKMNELQPGSAPLANFPPAEVATEDEFFVEAGINSAGGTYTEIKALLNNRSGWPARHGDKLSLRYYVDFSELLAAGVSPSAITLSTNYSQGATVSGPYRCGSSNIYYAVADFTGTDIYPGGQSAHRKEVQFRWAAPSATAYWNPANDPSYAGLSAGTVVKSRAIPVYSNGQKIFGDEPVACGGSPVLPPEAPQGLSASSSTGAISLSWGAVSTASSYLIKRSATGVPGSFNNVGSSVATSYPDSGLAAATAYYYQVSALNAGGEGPASSVVTASTPPSTTPPPPPPPTGGACTLTLDARNDWGAGQVLTVKLANSGTQPLSNWVISWTGSADFSIGNAWSSVVSLSGRNVTAQPAGWNSSIAPGSAAEFGLQLAYSGARPLPTNAQVQGLSCSVVVLPAN